MRIGEITKDNYTDYIKMFGGKNPQSLEEMWGKDKKTTGTEKSIPNKDTNTFGVSGMDITGMTAADFKIVKVSDEIKEQLTSLAKKVFLDNNGMNDGEEMSALMRKYIASTPEKDRKHVAYTLHQVWYDEYKQIEDTVKETIPGWKPGKAFDRDFVDELISKGGLDIKV